MRKLVVALDIGGTSSDLHLINGGALERVEENTIAGVVIQASQLDINTVAAGGGSILSFRSGMFDIGPDSAGSDPGPACYRKDGPLTVTDANLLTGRLVPSTFPHNFGPHHNQPIDVDATKHKFRALTRQINDQLRTSSPQHVDYTDEEVALHFLNTTTSRICLPIRAMMASKGLAAKEHMLTAFGGGGGQHACAIAHALGISSIYIHQYASVLSAFGIAMADIEHQESELCARELSEQALEGPASASRAAASRGDGKACLAGFPAGRYHHQGRTRAALPWHQHADDHPVRHVHGVSRGPSSTSIAASLASSSARRSSSTGCSCVVQGTARRHSRRKLQSGAHVFGLPK